MLRNLVVATIVLGCSLLHRPSAAYADVLDKPLAQLAAGDVNSMRAGLAELARIGDERALVVLQALKGRDLRVDSDAQRVFVEQDGQWVDALTKTPAANPDALSKPTLNNAVRRALGPALASLSLRSKDSGVRLDAARELSGSPTPALRDAIAEASSKEADAEVKQELSLALAKIDLTSEDEALKIAAIQSVEDTGDISLKGDLERIAHDERESAKVRSVALGAFRSLDVKQKLIRLAGDLFYGLSLGSVLMLAALGLAITFGLMGVINMAHGEMLMLGAYCTYAVQNFLRDTAPSALEWSLALAIPFAFLFCTLVGVLLERTVIKYLYGRPLETLLATWGISLALIQTVRLMFGAQNVAVSTPDWLSGGYEILSGVVLPYNRIAIVLFTVFVVTALWATLNKTPLGLHVRAVTQNRDMAAAMGIRTARVDMWTFGLGSGLAGLGGVALSQIGNVGPELGQSYIVDSFMVVVLGGVGKLAGTVFGALGIGVVNKLLEPLSGAVFGKILVLGFIILFIQRRPQGLFALRGRAAEG